MNKIKKATGFFESFDGTRIYYEVRGSGKPVVFCYGIGCLINHWRHQIRFFSELYQVIVFDFRGHHLSEVPKNRENLTIDGISEDIKQLLNHLKIEKASFWGHSFGAQVLIRTYDRYPEIFENMVMVNGFANNPIKGMFGTDVTTSMFKFFKEGYDQFPETIKYLWRAGTSHPLAIQLMSLAGGFNIELTSVKDIEVYLRALATINLDVFITLFQNMISYDGTSVLDSITVPTLIIGGKQDSVTPEHFQEILHEKIKGSEFTLIPYGSHCTQLDLPDFVNIRGEKFLSEHGYK